MHEISGSGRAGQGKHGKNGNTAAAANGRLEGVNRVRTEGKSKGNAEKRKMVWAEWDRGMTESASDGEAMVKWNWRRRIHGNC